MTLGRAGSVHTSHRPCAAFTAATTRAPNRPTPLRASDNGPAPATAVDRAGRATDVSVITVTPTTLTHAPATRSKPARPQTTASGVTSRKTLWETNCHQRRFLPGCSNHGIHAIN